jgi:coenzyme PQQ precursor peptide PqqA
MVDVQLVPYLPHGETEMTWKTPTIIEIALGAEINCYACAELK